MKITLPKYGTYSSSPEDFLPGPWSVYVDDVLVHDNLNERLAWTTFKSSCSHYACVGKNIVCKKNDRVVFSQKGK